MPRSLLQNIYCLHCKSEITQATKPSQKYCSVRDGKTCQKDHKDWIRTQLNGLKGQARSNKKWKLNHPEEVKAYGEMYRKINSEEEKLRVKRWRETADPHEIYLQRIEYKKKYYSIPSNIARLRETKKLLQRKYRLKQKLAQLEKPIIIPTIKA